MILHAIGLRLVDEDDNIIATVGGPNCPLTVAELMRITSQLAESWNAAETAGRHSAGSRSPSGTSGTLFADDA